MIFWLHYFWKILNSPVIYRSGNDKCKIFEKKQLIFPIDLSKILHLELPTRYIEKLQLREVL